MKKLENVDSPEKREEFRLKMCALQNQARIYRQAIDRYDKGFDDAKRAKILGKCYHKGYEWFRIDGFDIDYSPYGIKILEFTDSGDERPIYQIETNISIWEEDIEKFTQISNDEFHMKLVEIVNYIQSLCSLEWFQP